METIVKMMMAKDKFAGVLSLVKNESDYVIVKHLIHKVLEQLGRNVVFVQ